MTFRPARTGLAAASALLAASLAAPAAFAQDGAQAQGQGQGPQIVSPQSWPQCIVILEMASDMSAGPDGAASTAADFRESLNILAEANDLSQAELDQIYMQIRTALGEAEDSVILENAGTCMAGAPDPAALQVQAG